MAGIVSGWFVERSAGGEWCGGVWMKGAVLGSMAMPFLWKVACPNLRVVHGSYNVRD
jgi:hypothetical protein